MQTGFSVKTIQIAITLGAAQEAASGAGASERPAAKGAASSPAVAQGVTKLIEGLACEVTVEKPGLPEKNRASVKIWGLSYEDMSRLTMLAFRPLESRHNLLSVRAGEQDGALSQVFQGEIMSACADFNDAPDPCMQFQVESGCYAQQIALPVAAVSGEVPADRLFAEFARQAGYAYTNHGVTQSVRNACFPGSPVSKMRKLARDIGCQLFIDDGEVVVMPAGQARSGAVVPLSAATGMIDYPTFTQDGISCRCLFNPDLVHGGLIQVDSIVPRASGLWRITSLTHSIGAYLPGGGSWESRIQAAYNEE